MKAIKYIFILLLIVLIAGAVYFSLQDGTYEASREKEIDAPVSLVYDQVQDFRNWDNWNAWNKSEEVTVELGSQTAGVDGVFNFTDEHGTGTLTITRLDPNKAIDMKMMYDHAMGTSKADITYQFTEIENGTRMSITATGEQGLVEKAFATFTSTDIEEEIAEMYEKSLANMDYHLEQAMNEVTISPDGLIDYSGGYYLYMSSSTQIENLGNLQSQMVRNIRSFMDKNKIDTYGAPMVIYEKFDERMENVIFSAGIPVKDRVITANNSTILCGFQEPGKAVKVTLKGAYKYLPEAWQIGEGFITVNGLTRSSQPIFEVYKTDPYKIANPANYITEVYLPVQ